ncbi:hypothetical protein RHMOL_Rhmol13G0162000 [Rhododendron molle]|uniref:Uncharacterized protein n=1 Tax=Rhododendron molle TaxID=49168 RepID=A0ACC0L8S4_RHOML|nr:hypothetical protein RHMOL_Rhmol13G0162000 [Rhododendron molle]
MSNRTDPAWKYSKRHEDNKFKFTCNFCNKVVTGSVYRVKLHLAGGYPDVTSCPNCPEPVKEEIMAFINKKKETASSITPLPDFDEMGNEEDIDEDEFYMIGKKKNLMTLLFQMKEKRKMWIDIGQMMKMKILVMSDERMTDDVLFGISGILDC